MQQQLYREVAQHFNEPVLIGFDVCRCIGYAEDDDDCYLVAQHPQRGVIWHTMVGGHIFLDRLKGQHLIKSVRGDEEWDDFTRLDSLLELNGAPKQADFTVIYSPTPRCRLELQERFRAQHPPLPPSRRRATLEQDH